jgi:hypothetical protein
MATAVGENELRAEERNNSSCKQTKYKEEEQH